MYTLNDFASARLKAPSVFGHHQTKHGQRQNLRGVCLGRSHANFGACVDVNAAMGLARYGRTYSIGDAHN